MFALSLLGLSGSLNRLPFSCLCMLFLFRTLGLLLLFLFCGLCLLLLFFRFWLLLLLLRLSLFLLFGRLGLLLGFLLFLRLSLRLFLRSLSVFLVFLLCIGAGGIAEKQKQCRRADNSNSFHKSCLHYCRFFRLNLFPAIYSISVRSQRESGTGSERVQRCSATTKPWQSPPRRSTAT